MYPDQEKMLMALKKNERALGIRVATDIGDRLNIFAYDGTSNVSDEVLQHAKKKGVKFLQEILDMKNSTPGMFVTSPGKPGQNTLVMATIRLDQLVSADVISNLQNNQELGRG